MTAFIDIELPAEFRSGNDIPVTQATIKRERMQEILRVALEADRKQQGEVVVTKDEAGYIVAVTRQDKEGRILSVIAEADRKRIAKIRTSGSCAVCGSEQTELHTRCLECNAETVNYEQSQHNKTTHANRKRRTPPNEPFAIVIDRMYDGEGPSLAYWNGENYQFSDGDCFNREGDTLDGYTAEFLTDYQLEQRLFSDRERRGEPVAYVPLVLGSGKPEWSGTLPIGHELYEMHKDKCPWKPLYTAPQPSEPVNVSLDKAGAVGHAFSLVRRLKDGDPVENELRQVIRQIAAEPVKVPSEDQWGTLALWLDRRREYPTVMITGEVAGDIADRLARYGQPTEWQDFPK